MKPVRLNRYLALAGVASRRRCDEVIRAGRVSIDGQVVEQPGLQVVPGKNQVRLDGKLLEAVATVTWLLNKPVGVLSTASDPRGGRTVIDLAREAGIFERLYPVGRLDLKSRGLLLLSNDGDLAHRLIHPRFGVPKHYEVRINLPLTKTQMKRFAEGLTLSDGLTRPCRIRALKRRATYRVELKEGRKRQLRRMFEALNRRVIDLQRVAIGPIRVGRLPEGKLRRLSSTEERSLKECTGLK